MHSDKANASDNGNSSKCTDVTPIAEEQSPTRKLLNFVHRRTMVVTISIVILAASGLLATIFIVQFDKPSADNAPSIGKNVHSAQYVRPTPKDSSQDVLAKEPDMQANAQVAPNPNHTTQYLFGILMPTKENLMRLQPDEPTVQNW